MGAGLERAPGEVVAQRVHVVRSGENAARAFARFRNAARACRDDGQAGCHCFEERDGKAFGAAVMRKRRHGEDVARVAAQTLLHPLKHAGKTYRLGYDVQSYGDIAAIMTRLLGQPFRYDAKSPDVFLENMRAAGAEMAYMTCVHDNFTRMAARQIPGVEETFDNFPGITGREPVTWEDFVQKHRSAFAY